MDPLLVCHLCGTQVDKSEPHKVTTVRNVTRYWHNNPRDPGKDCWNAALRRTPQPSLQLVQEGR